MSFTCYLRYVICKLVKKQRFHFTTLKGLDVDIIAGGQANAQDNMCVICFTMTLCRGI
jgi:hypothetical protein